VLNLKTAKARWDRHPPTLLAPPTWRSNENANEG
jgi:hypothetical protein